MTPCIFESLLFICLLRKFVQLSIVSFVNCLLCQYSARHISVGLRNEKKKPMGQWVINTIKDHYDHNHIIYWCFFSQYHPSISPHSMRNHIVVVSENRKQYPDTNCLINILAIRYIVGIRCYSMTNPECICRF